MITMTDEYRRCKAALEAELRALAEAGAAQTLVSEAVKCRRWVDFEAATGTVRALASQVEELERERVALMGEKGGGNLRFYEYAMRFEDGERAELCGLYRAVKAEATRLRFSAEALARYLGECRTMVSGLLEAAFPERRGRIYGRSGAERNAGMGGIVLDRRF
jgi:hypothetical protein